MGWKPAFPGERPTLGHAVAQWMIDNLAEPDRIDYAPFYPTVEQYEFLLRFYEINPDTGKRIIRRGVLSRPRGWGKSPFLAAIAIAEGLADVVPDGWDADGRPVGKPWSAVRMPMVWVAASSEQQTQNAWLPLLDMFNDAAPVLDNYPGCEPMGTFVNLPYGRIQPITTSETSTKGAKPVFTILDQTEQWLPSNGGTRVADVLFNNSTKVGSATLESPNAYTPGRGSVAERSAAAWKAMAEGRTRVDKGLLYDHREAPPDTLLTDRDSLTAGLRYAYGDSSADPRGCVLHDPPCPPGWVDLDPIIARIWDLDSDEQLSRSDWLNQITHASDAWISQPDWAAAATEARPADGEPITLGFDGSLGRAKNKPDATALIGCTLEGGLVFPVGIWEADETRDTWAQWRPPLEEINEAVKRAFATWPVVAFYADPAREWRSAVNTWEAAYRRHLRVKVSDRHPCEWWMLGGRKAQVEQAVLDTASAIRNGELHHVGHDRLTAHVLNARRRLSGGKLRIDKDHPSSARKIDAAVAMVLAWQARMDAMSTGAVCGRRHRIHTGKSAYH